MIGIDIIRKKRHTDGASVSAKGADGVSVASGSEAQHAMRADEADHAGRADEAVHAQSAKEIDGGSTVWSTIRKWISEAAGALTVVFLRKDQDDETDHKFTMGEAVVKGKATVEKSLEVYAGATVYGDLDVDSSVTVSDSVSVGDDISLLSSGKGTIPYLTSGSVHSKDYTAGTGKDFDGSGYSLGKDASGKYGLAIDRLTVRDKMMIAELEIHEMSYVGGTVVMSPCGNRIDMVEKYAADGSPIGSTDTQTAVAWYRCYFLATDGERGVKNEWAVGQLARSKTNNVTAAGKYTGYENRDYWRLVVAVSKEPVEKHGKTYHWFDLSNSDSKDIALTGSDGKSHKVMIGGMSGTLNSEPQSGDRVAGMGHAWDTDRANLALMGVLGDDMGWTLYKGINDYATPASKIVNQFSVAGLTVDTDHFVMRPYGSDDAGLSGGAIVEAYNKIGTISATTKTLDGKVTELTQGQGTISAKVSEIGSGLEACGVDISKKTITLTSSRTTLKNQSGETVAIFDADGNLQAGSVTCGKGDVTVTVANGMVKALKGKAGVLIGLDDDGIPCLIGTDTDGKVLWRLGQRYETHGDDNFKIAMVTGSDDTYARSKGETLNGNGYVGIGGKLTVRITNGTNQAVILTKDNFYARMSSKTGAFLPLRSGGSGSMITLETNLAVGETKELSLYFGRCDSKGSTLVDAGGYSGGQACFTVCVMGKDYTPLGSTVGIAEGGTFFGTSGTPSYTA